MRLLLRVLWWIGKTCKYLHWAKWYFVFPPDESNAEEMEIHRQRLSN